MKSHWMRRVAGAALMISLGAGLAGAQEAATDEASRVKASEARFHAVASHLDLGGDFYFYLNLEDLVEAAMTRGRELPALFAEEDMVAMINEKLEVADEVLRDAGIYNLASIGVSSKPMPGGLNTIKSFVGIDDFLSQGSLWKALGGAPSAMAIHTFLPEGPSLVRSQNLDLAAAWSWVRSVVARVGGEEALAQIDQGLEQGKEATGIHLNQLLGALGTSFMFSAYLDPSQTVALPLGPEPTEFPTPSGLIAIEVRDATIHDLLQTKLVEGGMLLTNQVVDGVEILLTPQPFPAPVPLQPAMAQIDGFLLIASSPDLLRRALAARAGTGRFLDSDAFARVFAGMPGEVNGLAYIDASVSELIIDAQMAGMQNASSAPPQLVSAMREWMKLFAQGEGAAVQLNLPDGILVQTISSASGRQQIAVLGAVVPIAFLAGIAMPAFTQAQGQAVEAACANNLRMIDAAKQMWALDADLAEGDMPSPDGLQPYFPGGLPVCPEGGAYTLGPIGTPPSCSLHGSAEDF